VCEFANEFQSPSFRSLKQTAVIPTKQQPVSLCINVPKQRNVSYYHGNTIENRNISFEFDVSEVCVKKT